MSGSIPKRPGGDYIPLWRCPPRGRVQAVIQSPGLVLAPYHGGGSKSLLCPAFIGRRCRACEGGNPARQERWGEVWLLQERERVVASFTEAAVKHCPRGHDLLSDPRGLVVTFSRLAGAFAGVRLVVGERVTMKAHHLYPPRCDVPRWVLAVYDVNMSDLPASMPLLVEEESKTQDITNVAQSAAAPPLRLVAGLEGFGRIDGAKVNAHNAARLAEANGKGPGSSIGDTSTAGVSPQAFLRLVRPDAGPAGMPDNGSLPLPGGSHTDGPSDPDQAEASDDDDPVWEGAPRMIGLGEISRHTPEWWGPDDEVRDRGAVLYVKEDAKLTRKDVRDTVETWRERTGYDGEDED